MDPLIARKRLGEACERYKTHNEHVLYDFIPRKPDIPLQYFDGYPGGFSGWVMNEYFLIAKSIFGLEHGSIDTAIIWHIESDDENKLRFNGALDGCDICQSDPSVVLSQLNAIIRISHTIMTEKNHEQNFSERLSNYQSTNNIGHDNRVDVNETDPLPTQIYNTLNQLISLIGFIGTLEDYREWAESPFSVGNRTAVLTYPRLIEIKPIFEQYLKGIIVNELSAILNSNLSNEEALRQVELKLAGNYTLDLLAKNHQSRSEINLKILSVVSILIGVGIFTTLGLAFKRLYDTGGSSINFFKPLSKNLHEDIETITSNIDYGL